MEGEKKARKPSKPRAPTPAEVFVQDSEGREGAYWLVFTGADTAAADRWITTHGEAAVKYFVKQATKTVEKYVETKTVARLVTVGAGMVEVSDGN